MSDADFFWDGIEDDDDVLEEEEKYLIVHVDNRSLALPQSRILSMLVCPEITPMPETADWNPGVIKVRETLYPVVDLRIKLGLPSLGGEMDELIEGLDQREREHQGWIEALMDSIKNNTPFALSKDPHQCEFGKWYDNFKSENMMLEIEVRKFEQPHNAIHATADMAFDIKERKGTEEALKFIETRKKSTLEKMIQLFERTKTLLRDNRRTIAILMSVEPQIALLVDRVESFQSLNVEDNSFTKKSSSELPLGKRAESDKVYPVITPEWITQGL